MKTTLKGLTLEELTVRDTNTNTDILLRVGDLYDMKIVRKGAEEFVHSKLKLETIIPPNISVPLELQDDYYCTPHHLYMILFRTKEGYQVAQPIDTSLELEPHIHMRRFMAKSKPKKSTSILIDSSKTTIQLIEGDSYNLRLYIGARRTYFQNLKLERIVFSGETLTPSEAVRYYGEDNIIAKGDLGGNRGVNLFMFKTQDDKYVTLPISVDGVLKRDIAIVEA